MKIIIAGYGFVGTAVADSFKEKHDVIVVDPKYTDAKIMDHHDADGIIICVGTPSTPRGGCDSRDVCGVLDEVPESMPILIKSTISIDVIEALEAIYPRHNICYSPEFLRAESASNDFAKQSYMILGGNDTNEHWGNIFRTALPKLKTVFYCSAKEASITKYSINSFLATKVAFFNQIYDICQSNNIDYDVVRTLITLDNRIGTSHTLVPGPDGDRGFGGACLPKDAESFKKHANDLNTPITILDSAIEYNKTVRKNLTLS
jgi:UDPglucose 6-dehydrogenase